MISIIDFFINLLSTFITPISNLFKKLTIKIDDVDCHLSKPPIPDGEGGFFYGSYAYFTLSYINRKDKHVIIENIHCVATQNDVILQDNIACKDKNSKKLIAKRPVYDHIFTLDITPQSSGKYEIVLNSSSDLSKCDKLTFCYSKGIRKSKIVIWQK